MGGPEVPRLTLLEVTVEGEVETVAHPTEAATLELVLLTRFVQSFSERENVFISKGEGAGMRFMTQELHILHPSLLSLDLLLLFTFLVSRKEISCPAQTTLVNLER